MHTDCCLFYIWTGLFRVSKPLNSWLIPRLRQHFGTKWTDHFSKDDYDPGQLLSHFQNSFTEYGGHFLAHHVLGKQKFKLPIKHVSESSAIRVCDIMAKLSGCGCSVQCVMFTTCIAATSVWTAGSDLQADQASRSHQRCGQRSQDTSRNSAGTRTRLRPPLHS